VVRVRILKEARYLLVTDDNNRILILRPIFSQFLQPGEYTEPEDVVEIFKHIATKGHKTRNEITNPHVLYTVIVSILERDDLPEKDKLEMIKRVIWGELHRQRR